MTCKIGQTVRYLSYGVEKTATIERIGRSGTLFIGGGRFLFPQSVLGVGSDMKPFIFNQWHVWSGTQAVLLSDESSKDLREFRSPDDCINWLYLNGHKDAARALDAHIKAG